MKNGAAKEFHAGRIADSLRLTWAVLKIASGKGESIHFQQFVAHELNQLKNLLWDEHGWLVEAGRTITDPMVIKRADGAPHVSQLSPVLIDDRYHELYKMAFPTRR